MDDIEKDVRIRVGNDFANIAKEFNNNYGEMAAIKLDYTNHMRQYMESLVKSNQLLQSSMDEYLVSDVQNSLSKLENTPNEIAGFWIMSFDDINTPYNNILNELNEENYNDITEHFNEVKDLYDKRDSIIKKIISKQENTESLNDEEFKNILYSSIRDEYTTAEDYINKKDSMYIFTSEFTKFMLKGMVSKDTGITEFVIPEALKTINELYILKIHENEAKAIFNQ